jgi:DNA-binding LacI/PurR family transcriptional regulator
MSEIFSNRVSFPSITQVAKLAGVSPSTASRVLAQRGYRSTEARKRVERAAQELGYEPHLAAQTLKTQASRMVAVVIQDITNPFYAFVAKGIADVTRRSGFAVLLADSQEDREREEESLRIMVQSRVAGIIIAPTARSAVALRAAQQRGIAIIQIDRTVPNVLSDTVLVDNFAGAYSATKYLLDLGHTRIAVITGPRSLTTGRARLQGFEAAMKERGVVINRRYVKVSDFRRDTADSLARELLDEKPPPTAVFAHNNILAESTLAAIAERKLRVPRDVAVIGFDDPPWAQLAFPPLTVVRQPAYEMGAIAADLLIRRLAHVRGDEAPMHVVLQPSLVVRGSQCGAKASARHVANSAA